MDSVLVAKGLSDCFEYSEGSIVTTYAVGATLKENGYPDPFFDNEIWFEATDMAFPVLPGRRFRSNFIQGTPTIFGYLRAIRDIKPKEGTGFYWRGERDEDGTINWICDFKEKKFESNPKVTYQHEPNVPEQKSGISCLGWGVIGIAVFIGLGVVGSIIS